MARPTPGGPRHHGGRVPCAFLAETCAWTSPVHAGNGSVHVDPPCPRNEQPWVASLGSAFPLLAQEVLDLVHQLLRVEVVVTPWARRRVPRRVIVLL